MSVSCLFSSSRRRYLTRLEVLSIKNNRIAHINYHFCSLTQLRELSLSHNELKVRVQRGIAQRNKRARTRAHTHTSRPTHMHIHTFANPPKHEIMRIVSAALARVSESHGGKPPRRRRRLRRRRRRRRRRGGLPRILQNTTRECSCSTNVVLRTTTLTRVTLFV